MSEHEKNTWEPASSKLKLKSRKVEEEIFAPPPPPKKPAKVKKAKPAKSSGKMSIRFLSMSIGSFIFGSLIFGAFIYHQANNLEILSPQQANMTRGIAVIAFFVILVIEAFQEDLIQGVVSLFLPPYAFVYGILFADAGPVRGLTMAMLVFLSAEVYFTPETALVPNTLSAINEWINAGQQKLINPDKPDAGFEK